jgi:hypothetical protein
MQVFILSIFRRSGERACCESVPGDAYGHDLVATHAVLATRTISITSRGRRPQRHLQSLQHSSTLGMRRPLGSCTCRHRGARTRLAWRLSSRERVVATSGTRHAVHDVHSARWHAAEIVKGRNRHVQCSTQVGVPPASVRFLRTRRSHSQSRRLLTFRSFHIPARDAAQRPTALARQNLFRLRSTWRF